MVQKGIRIKKGGSTGLVIVAIVVVCVILIILLFLFFFKRLIRVEGFEPSGGFLSDMINSLKNMLNRFIQMIRGGNGGSGGSEPAGSGPAASGNNYYSGVDGGVVSEIIGNTNNPGMDMNFDVDWEYGSEWPGYYTKK